MSKKPLVLCLSGLDPSGGAGIQADIEALMATGCHCLPVVTSLTVQDTRNVASTHPVDVALLREQIHLLLDDLQIQAVKIGLIDSLDVLGLISEVISGIGNIPVVADPVLTAGGGFRFSGEELIAAYKKLILPHCTVLTPNTDELGMLCSGARSAETSAAQLHELGCPAVLLTGTHADSTDVRNYLFQPGLPAQSWSWPRLPGEYHGSGCTLASALAGALAKGLTLPAATEQAQTYTWGTLKTGWIPGKGQYVPDRGFSD